MMQLSRDFKEFLQSLNDNGVRYLVVNGCFVFGLFALMQPAAARPQTFRSPDHALRATQTTNKMLEARVIIRSRRGKILLNKSFVSQDGQHGRVIKRAAWSPDSQFFVFATSSSGGHSPWQFTTYFWSRRTCRLLRLDDFIGAVTTPRFLLKKPDFIETKVLKKSGEIEGEPISAKLSDLEKRKK